MYYEVIHIFKSGFTLTTDSHLQAAAFNKTDICVWQHGKLIEYGGHIEKISDVAVTINGEKYLKATCEFKVR
ncbi:hypothetical protein J31TS4_19330 [Paenibacillus sp. J31TS4]|nr:hypothetical protein J31TS4_19330 [Paenibacillus sp. J31TS4]